MRGTGFLRGAGVFCIIAVLLLSIMLAFTGCTTAPAGPRTPAAPRSEPPVAPKSGGPDGIVTAAPPLQPGPQAGAEGTATPPAPSGTVRESLNPAGAQVDGGLLPVQKPGLVPPSFRVTPLVPVNGEPWTSYATFPLYDFSYRSAGYPLSIPYNTGAYESAKKQEPWRSDQRFKEFAQLYTISNDWWYLALPTQAQQDWYLGIMADPAQNMTYDAILTRMRQVRDEYQLDDNEYAELIARFVQRAIPDQANPYPLVERYPIETIGDLGGTRNDRSLLLAGLLAREGYGVALIYFPDVNGMLVGIRGDGKAPEYDGYLAIDPSTETFFGVYAPKAAAIIPSVQYFADYKVIKVSDGKRYTAGTELRVIWDRLLFMNFYDRLRDYTRDLRFVYQNRDNRHLVFEYLAYLGPYS
jgi:hypothetical protein